VEKKGLSLFDTGKQVAVPIEPYDKIRALEAATPLMCAASPNLELLDLEALTNHEFCDGVYARSFLLPTGAWVISKMHAHENFFLLFKGDVSIYAADGTSVRVKAPFLMVTVPGTKRAVYAHEEAIIYNFHGNPENEKEVPKLEAKFIIPEAKPTLPPGLARKLLGRD